MDSIYITLTEKLFGGTSTRHLSFDENSPGEMNVKGEFTGQITCPECQTLLALSAGSLARLDYSSAPGSTPTQESQTGIDGWSIAYNEPVGWIIALDTGLYTLTDQQIASLKPLLGFHSPPWQLSALEGLLGLHKNIPWCTILLQVHDSVVFQLPFHRVSPNSLRLVREHLEVTVPYSDPLTIGWGLKRGDKNWHELSPKLSWETLEPLKKAA